MARSKLENVLLGVRPGDSSAWAKATGREYDLRAAAYGASGYAVTVNRDRVRAGTTGWMCLRDGSFGFLAGLCIFTDAPQPEDADGISYASGIIFPLPREYWVDGARIRLSGWSGRAPFCDSPNRFQNGEELKAPDVSVLSALLPTPVMIWRSAVLRDEIRQTATP